MTGPGVIGLRYVAMATPDFEKSAEFYGGVWGLTRVEGEGGLSYLAADGSPEQFILRVREADERRIDVVSFAAASAQDVDAIATRLADAGVRFASEPGDLQTPGGGYGFRFFDPEGRVIEVSSDVERRSFREIAPEEPTPKGLSHVVLMSSDVKATTAWYQDNLGFRLSDWVGETFSFMRCSPDYHSLAFAQSKHTSLNHVCFEMRGLDEVMRGMGRALKHEVPLRHGPGYFGNARSAFAYFYDPAGNVIEYASPQLQVTDEAAWKPRVLGPGDTEQWGIGRGDEVVPENAKNVPDPGLWVAPPV